MLEDVITSLSEMGLDYTEDGQGGLTVDISTVDKSQLIDVINVVNDSGLEFMIDATTITITGVPMPEDPMEADPQEMALEDAMEGMY